MSDKEALLSIISAKFDTCSHAFIPYPERNEKLNSVGITPCTFCKYKEQWILWFILDVIQTILYFVIGQPVMAVMYIAWTINTIYGYVCWTKTEKLVD